MKTRGKVVAALVALACAIWSPLPAQDQPDPAAGTLELRVMIVGAELDVRPVPKRRFRIHLEDGTVESLTTGFDGTVAAPTPAGLHRITSETPLEFQGSVFEWDVPVEVAPGETTVLELSNDNATVTAATTPEPEPTTTSEGDIYEKNKGSVFKVLSESGHGSGFLVADTGLVLTNHHVVEGSPYLAVKCDNERKFPARLVVGDAVNDLAVLQINPEGILDIPALVLAPDTPDAATVTVGDRIVAIGSPLAAEGLLTAGIVSKVEEGAIYSDININPGNSGGPSFDLEGRVIGVNTFLLASAGQGVSGIVRIHLARALIESATETVAQQEPPPATRLPVEAPYRFPSQELQRLATTRSYNPSSYHVEAGKIDVQLITPPLIAYLETSAEREAAEGRNRRNRGKQGTTQYAPGSDYYEWRRYAGDYRPVVIIQAVPEIKMTAGSAFAIALLGAAAPTRFKFKTDFDRMELRRDGELIEPLHPGRIKQVINVEGQVTMKDVGFYGVYEYPPEAFRPGAKLTLHCWQQGRPIPTVHTIKPEKTRRVWDDFETYYRELIASAEQGEDIDLASLGLIEGTPEAIVSYLERDGKWHKTGDILGHVPMLREDYTRSIGELVKSGRVERSAQTPMRYRIPKK
jgi:S1-C subfamily serine protease